jgi:hypothetical protein
VADREEESGPESDKTKLRLVSAATPIVTIGKAEIREERQRAQ